MNAVITIECRVCGAKLETWSVSDAIAFDRRHTDTCSPEAAGATHA